MYRKVSTLDVVPSFQHERTSLHLDVQTAHRIDILRKQSKKTKTGYVRSLVDTAYAKFVRTTQQ